VTLPRFIQGRFGKITAANLNDVFETIEHVQGSSQVVGGADVRPYPTIIARIVGCTTDAVQGVGQATTVGTSGATARRAWLYNWEEVQLGVADWEATPGVGSCVSHTGPEQVNGGFQSQLTGDTIYVPAIDFTPEARLAPGDLVALNLAHVRIGSKYVQVAVVSLLEPTTFLARLTSKHAVDGVYFFSAVTATQPLALSTVRPAVNLYEINAIRSRSSTYASVLALTEGSATTTFSGSNDWGHGQSLTGAGATVTKSTMPVGAAGTGSLVVMHRAVVEWDTTTPREAITAYYCFYAVPPVSAACD